MSDEVVAVSNLEGQIHSQPDEIARIVASAQVHGAVERLQRCHRIWLVGTGTSQHAAELGAAMFHDAGRAAQAVSSMHFVDWAPLVGPQDGVIVISHNAGSETTFAAAARLQSLGAGMKVVSITRQGGGLPEAIETVPKETSETYTVSYAGALIVVAMIAAQMGSESVTDEAIGRVAPSVAAAIVNPGTEAIPLPRRCLVLFGAGPASVTAREGALKVREASRTLTEGYDVEYLLHGSAVPLTTEDHLVALWPPDISGLVAGVAGAAESEGIAVTRVRETAELPPLLAQIPLTARLQLLALRFAVAKGVDPDHVIAGGWAEPDLWSIGAPRTAP